MALNYMIIGIVLGYVAGYFIGYSFSKSYFKKMLRCYTNEMYENYKIGLEKMKGD